MSDSQEDDIQQYITDSKSLKQELDQQTKDLQAFIIQKGQEIQNIQEEIEELNKMSTEFLKQLKEMKNVQ